jgi:IclR family transcriptional regulator, KDG regulon repressor
MEQKKSNQEYILGSVRNALRILKSFSVDQPEKQLTDLAVTLGLSKSTVSRLMSTLALEDFVQQDPHTKLYRLGLSVLPLGGIVTSNQEVLRSSLPLVHRLVDRIGESVHFLVLEDEEVSFVYSVEKNHLLRYYTNIGKKSPIHCTSSGKVILAYQSAETVSKITSHGLRSFTVKTIKEPHALQASLEKVRLQGYGVSFEEYMEGMMDFAAPIRNGNGEVFAAISVSGSVQQFTRKKIPYYLKEMINTSDAISQNLHQQTIKKERL